MTKTERMQMLRAFDLTTKQSLTVEAMVRLNSQALVAAELGATQQNVSQTLRTPKVAQALAALEAEVARQEAEAAPPVQEAVPEAEADPNLPPWQKTQTKVPFAEGMKEAEPVARRSFQVAQMEGRFDPNDDYEPLAD